MVLVEKQERAIFLCDLVLTGIGTGGVVAVEVGAGTGAGEVGRGAAGVVAVEVGAGTGAGEEE